MPIRTKGNTYLVAVFSGDSVQKNSCLDDVLLAMPLPVLCHHHLLAPRPDAVKQPVYAKLVLVVDSLLLGLEMFAHRDPFYVAIVCRGSGPMIQPLAQPMSTNRQGCTDGRRARRSAGEARSSHFNLAGRTPGLGKYNPWRVDIVAASIGAWWQFG